MIGELELHELANPAEFSAGAAPRFRTRYLAEKHREAGEVVLKCENGSFYIIMNRQEWLDRRKGIWQDVCAPTRDPH